VFANRNDDSFMQVDRIDDNHSNGTFRLLGNAAVDAGGVRGPAPMAQGLGPQADDRHT
jgi:hypothetical protein